MKPSHTGAASHCDGCTIGTSSRHAPETTLSHPAAPSGTRTRGVLRHGGARRSRTIAINSPVSKIAGEIVANDHA